MTHRPRKTATLAAPPASASRFLVQCGYDFRQRVWNLPAAQLSRAEAARVLSRLQDYTGGLRALSRVVTGTLSEFASPGRGDLLTPARPRTVPKRVRPSGLRAGKFYPKPAVQP